jgi:predicted HTH transcriptional regulator
MTLQQTTLWDERHHAALTAQADAQRERYRRRADGRGRHNNSLAAHGELTSTTMSARRAAIVAWLAAHGPATDRQVRDALFGIAADMNMVRPRITELLDAGALRECGSVECEVTGRRVRQVKVTGVSNE